jgi:mono/diheme cytochrome c family protein
MDAASAARFLPALLLGLSVVAAAVGLALAARLRAERPNPTVEIEGLQLRLERASWTDRYPELPWDAHESIDLKAPWLGPRSSVQGMPAAADRRLALTLLARNVTRAEQHLAWGELVLRAGMAPPRTASADMSEPILTSSRSPDDGGASVPSVAPVLGRLAGDVVTIPAGHAVVLDASFEVRAADAELALWWERHTARARLLVTRTPRQRTDGPPRRWPLAASELPAGRPAAGGRLFHGRLACASCHGDPEAPDARGAGPALRAIGREAGLRQRDRSAAQYLYESLLDPSAFLSPACADQPCANVQMPAYGEVLSPQEAADLVAFLLAQRRAAIR